MGLENNKIVRRFVNIDEKNEGSTTMGIFVGAFAAFGGLLYGYDTGTISGILAMKYVIKEFAANGTEFTSSEKSLIVSILSVGTFFGAILAPLLSDTIGRRFTIIIASLVVFNVGVILQAASTGIPLLCAGRAIAGFGVGLISSCIPLYQSEASPKWIRGAVVSCYQWAITIGLLLASLVNQGSHARNDSGSYRIPICIQFLWALILGVGMLFLPETPRFYVSKGDHDRAKISLAKLRRLDLDHPDLIEEHADIKAAYDFETHFGKSSWKQLFSTDNQQFKRLMTGIWIQAFQQLTGVNFIFYFGTTFFESVGLNGFISNLATNIVNVGSTIPGILLTDVIGRRKILIGGAIGMCVSQYIVAIVGVATPADSKASGNVLIAFSCIFIAFFAATWGPSAWVVVGEIFPLRTRAKSVALSAASNWLWNWAIAYATPYMVDPGKGNGNLGVKVFFVWASCNFLCILFSWALVYETKGLSLEQVDEMYELVPHAWKSPGFVPSIHSFRDNALSIDVSSSKAKFVSEEKIEEVSV